EIWAGLGRSAEQAYALYCAGMIAYSQTNEWETAFDLAYTSARLYADLEKSALEASTIYLQAISLTEIANNQSSELAKVTYARSIALLEQAAKIQRQLGNDYNVGKALNQTGLVHFYLGDLNRAESLWRMAADKFANLHETKEELLARQNLAVVDIDRGYNKKAIEVLTYVLENTPADADEDRAYVLDNLGIAYGLSGDMDNALQALSESYNVYLTIGDHVHQARALKGIGSTYYYFGELDLAAQYLRRAAKTAEQVSDRRTLAGINSTLGDIAYRQEDFENAFALHEKAVNMTDSDQLRAHRLVLTAKDLDELGDYAAARAYTARAKQLAEGSGSIDLYADAWLTEGVSHTKEGSHSTGNKLIRESLEVYKRLGMKTKQAEAHHRLSQSAEQQGDIEQAIEQARRALALTEAVREQVAAPELRAFFASTRRDYLETLVRNLLTLHKTTGQDQYLRAALTASERGRARMTMDLVNQAAIEVESTVDPKLQRRKNDLFEELAALRHQRDTMSTDHEGGQDDKERDNIVFNMGEVENQLNLLELSMQKSSSRYANLTAPDLLSAAQIQSVLDPDTVLLQYQLGDETSFLWVVDHQNITGFDLPERSSIEQSSRRAFETLSHPQRGRIADEERSRNLQELADKILAPARKLLRPRIIVAAEGALQYIPFGVLPLASTDSRPLASQHEIVVVPSISVISAQKARRQKEPTKTIAVIADPVFSLDDPRFSNDISSAVGITSNSSVLTRSSVATNLSRLPSTKHEADEISSLVPPEDRWVATGFSANRKAVLDKDLTQYRFVHFATHGLVDSRYPALSALALSQFDPHGSRQAGFLRLNDIYSLKLNADLVVLSACNTALGREIRGEGLIGLTQGFMYAGARGLVVSLWQVPDVATAELMKNFYNSVINHGVRPARALADAQLQISSRGSWRNPYYWGAFVLVGSWKD
ncbi:MAG: CHAT domain-containing protein, partial [Gammaproteobacteria bacterium]|nr:CHAT domain-containing protein [Gammaproteobacteria bacterium]